MQQLLRVELLPWLLLLMLRLRRWRRRLLLLLLLLRRLLQRLLLHMHSLLVELNLQQLRCLLHMPRHRLLPLRLLRAW